MVTLGLIGVAPLVTGDLAPAGSALDAASASAAAAGARLDRTGAADPAEAPDDLEVPEDGLAETPRDDEGDEAAHLLDEAGLEGWSLDEDDPAYDGVPGGTYGADEMYEDLPDDLGQDFSDGSDADPAGPPATEDRAPSGPPSAPAPTTSPTTDPTTGPTTSPAPAPSASGPAPPAPAPTTSQEPDGPDPGADRSEAAARRALAEHPDGAPTVHLVVDGSLWAVVAASDGGWGGASDGGYAVPVLLTTARCLPAATATAITDLGARDVVLLGPRGAVTAEALTTTCPPG